MGSNSEPVRIVSDFALAVVTIFQEARGEPFAGKIAVGEVIRNRAKHSNKTVAEVVLKPEQFSGFNTNDPNRTPSFLIDDGDPVVKECATAWLASETSNLTEGATNYYNPDIATPSWASAMKDPIHIGSHLFGVA